MTGRGLGIAAALGELLPPAVRELFALLTTLGDAGVLLGGVALYYWFGERERGAFALATVLGATALTLALKGLFALPRPPTALHVGHAAGYGFPSGHAITATATFGVLALALDRWYGRARAAAAGAIVAVVAASRVVIGVHYAVDVAVGIAAGLAYLAALVRMAEWQPGHGFAVATALGLAAVVANGFTPDAVAAVAGALGASATWATFGTSPESSVGVPAALAGLGALGAVGYAGNALGVGLPAVFALNLAVPAGILALPVAVGCEDGGVLTVPDFVG